MLLAVAGPNDDAQLMTRYAAGEVAAFETLYARHKGPLYRYFFRQCGNPDNADELFEDVWLRVIKARAGYEPKDLFTTYMYRIAHNCLVDHYRNAGLSLTGAAGEPAAEGIPGPFTEEVDPAFASARWSLVDWEQGPTDSSTGPEAVSSDELRASRLRSALNALPIAQREAFLLHEEADMCLDDITAVISESPETVKSRLRYAVEKLRSSLGDLAPVASRGAVS
jgi:RNA polymerase sigma-70 factor (ECF subfamily)